MKVLVTGATGMVGSEVVRQLIAEGASVRILRRDSSSLDLLGDARTNVEHAIGDIRDDAAVLRAMQGVDHVYHTAGYIGFSGGSDYEKLHAVNVQGTATVVNAALRSSVSRLVHTSSMAAFGRPERPHGVIDERSAWVSSKYNSTYAHTKYLGELEVHRAVAEGLDAVIVNPALIFGIGRPGENTRAIVEKVKRRRFPGIPAGGTNVVDVRDVARGHRLAMLNGQAGERYFLGSENLSWRDILGTIANAFDVKPPPLSVPPWLAMGIAVLAESFAAVTRTRAMATRETVRTANRFYRYSNEKAVRELGCEFRPFAETAEYLANALSDEGR